MNDIALQESGSKSKGPFADCAHPGQAFIWLPFAGGISAFAVILPKPGEAGPSSVSCADASHVDRCEAARSERKTVSHVGS